MKYLKIYEKFNDPDKTEKKVLDYKKYYGKYIIFKYLDIYYLAKYIKNNKFNNVVIDYYWINMQNEFCCSKDNSILHISEIDILSSYDTLEEAITEYMLILDSKKFNL